MQFLARDKLRLTLRPSIKEIDISLRWTVLPEARAKGRSLFSPRRSGDRGQAGIDAAPYRRQRRDTTRDPVERVSEEDAPSVGAPYEPLKRQQPRPSARRHTTYHRLMRSQSAVPRRSTAAEKHSYNTIHSLSTAPGGFAINSVLAPQRTQAGTGARATWRPRTAETRRRPGTGLSAQGRRQACGAGEQTVLQPSLNAD